MCLVFVVLRLKSPHSGFHVQLEFNHAPSNRSIGYEHEKPLLLSVTLFAVATRCKELCLGIVYMKQKNLSVPKELQL